MATGTVPAAEVATIDGTRWERVWQDGGFWAVHRVPKGTWGATPAKRGELASLVRTRPDESQLMAVQSFVDWLPGRTGASDYVYVSITNGDGVWRLPTAGVLAALERHRAAGEEHVAAYMLAPEHWHQGYLVLRAKDGVVHAVPTYSRVSKAPKRGVFLLRNAHEVPGRFHVYFQSKGMTREEGVATCQYVGGFGKRKWKMQTTVRKRPGGEFIDIEILSGKLTPADVALLEQMVEQPDRPARVRLAGEPLQTKFIDASPAPFFSVPNPTPDLGAPWMLKVPEGMRGYHGTDDPEPLLKLQTFDWNHLRRRDAGFFGAGFYLARTPQEAKAHGAHVLEVELDGGINLLRGLDPADANGIVPTGKPGYHALMRSEWIEQTFESRGHKMERAKVEEIFDGLYDPTSDEFDRLGWYKEVASWVRRTGVASGVLWGEIVLTDPYAIASIRRVAGRVRAAAPS